jgi:hypothetical protein
MNKRIELPVIDTDGRTTTWVLECAELDEDSRTILAINPEQRRWQGRGPDWFDALQDLRKAMETDGYRLLCAGARANARVSGMLAGMSGGESVYLLQPGRSPTSSVWLFAPADPADVVSVAEQDEFYERWLRSSPRPRLSETVAAQFRELYHRIRYR